MKKWSNPELKNLSLDNTKETKCPNMPEESTLDVSIWDCVKCGWNGHNYRCDVCGGCQHPDWEPGNCLWPAHKQCTCQDS